MEKSRSYLLEDREKAKEESLRLKAQAKMLFQIELSALRDVGLTTPRCILDIGCGNGSYLELFHEQFPKCKLVGIDRNKTLLEDLGDGAIIDTRVSDITDSENLRAAIRDVNPDILISRYVFQHLSANGMAQILKSVKWESKNSRRLILIDTSDLEISFNPPCPALSGLSELKRMKQSALGGNRTIGSKLKQLLQEHGFEDVREKKLEFTNQNLSWDIWMAIFWPVIRSGTNEIPTQEQFDLITQALAWFEFAKMNRDYFASWTVYYVSGI